MTMTMENKERLIDLFLEFKYQESAEGRYWSPTKYAKAKYEYDFFTQKFDGREVAAVINEYLKEQV